MSMLKGMFLKIWNYACIGSIFVNDTSDHININIYI